MVLLDLANLQQLAYLWNTQAHPIASCNRLAIGGDPIRSMLFFQAHLMTSKFKVW
jgi:hypothetical protein